MAKKRMEDMDELELRDLCNADADPRETAARLRKENRRLKAAGADARTTPPADLDRLAVQAETIASLERGVRGEDTATVFPNWVYEARDAIRHQNANLPWLPDLLAALGWQGGTIHDALNAVRRLVAASKVPPHSECDACGSPNNPDGSCSRSQCYNSD